MRTDGRLGAPIATHRLLEIRGGLIPISRFTENISSAVSVTRSASARSGTTAWERLRETALEFGDQRIDASGTAIM